MHLATPGKSGASLDASVYCCERLTGSRASSEMGQGQCQIVNRSSYKDIENLFIQNLNQEYLEGVVNMQVPAMLQRSCNSVQW